MSKPVNITTIKGRAYRKEIGNALINTTRDLSNTALMTNKDGANGYLPVYRSGIQTSGGSQAFAPSLDADGTLTIFLEAVPSPEIASQVGAGRPNNANTSFSLVFNETRSRVPLTASIQGALLRVVAKLTDNDLKTARAALFDLSPNVAVEVTQTAEIAAPLSRDFVLNNWANNSIRQGLIDTFQVSFDDPSTFYDLATQMDPEYASEFIVLNCTYRDNVPAPALPGYIQWQVDWNGRAYNYYQDNQDRGRVFYCPESFEFAKGPTGAPAVSLLQFSLPEGQTTVDKTQATFRIYGKPVVQFQRIENAKRSLTAKIGTTPEMVSLQDARNVKASFTQVLPNATGTSSNPKVQPNPTIDLSVGVRNELNLNFDQFRALWAAIFSQAPENPLFRGWVDVELSEGRYKERIDFSGRLPKQQEAAFFDDILDTSAEITYSVPLNVKTFPKVFQEPSDKQVQELEVNFGTGAVAALTSEKLVNSITVQRSIRDIVLGNQNPNELAYRLQVIRRDGTITCCPGKVDSKEATLWIKPEQVTKCTGDCG